MSSVLLRSQYLHFTSYTADQGIPFGFANLFPLKIVGAGLAIQFFTTCEGWATA